RRGGSRLPFALTGAGRGRGRKDQAHAKSEEKTVPRVEDRDVGEAHVAELGPPARYGDGHGQRQERQLREGQQSVLGQWHGERERDRVALAVNVPELRRVAVLQPDLQDARERRVGLLDEIRLRLGTVVVGQCSVRADHDGKQRDDNGESHRLFTMRRWRVRTWPYSRTLV